MYSLLLLEPDVDSCTELRSFFETEGVVSRVCENTAEALELEKSEQYDLLVMEMMLPDSSGFDFLTQLRSVSQIPVVVTTGRDSSVDRIVALEMGADDYIAKPYDLRELLARVRTIIRRSKNNYPARVSGGCEYFFDDIVIDRNGRIVRRDGISLGFTQVEFVIFEMLVEEAGHTVSRDQISRKALGKDLESFDRSIDVHISNLRKKLGTAPQRLERIVTVRGVGYFYSMPSSQEELLSA